MWSSDGVAPLGWLGQPGKTGVLAVWWLQLYQGHHPSLHPLLLLVWRHGTGVQLSCPHWWWSPLWFSLPPQPWECSEPDLWCDDWSLLLEQAKTLWSSSHLDVLLWSLFFFLTILMSPCGVMEAGKAYAAMPLDLSLWEMGGQFQFGGMLLNTCTIAALLVLYQYPVDLDAYPLLLECPRRSE